MVDLYWIPLGAGGHSVRLTGLAYAAISGRDIYHAALIVDGHAIEVAPVWAGDDAMVASGAVGSRLLGRWSLFRYGVCCRRDGTIPDLAEAVGGPHRVSSDPAAAHRILDAIATVPRPVWGRDELAAGEMWTSNSVVAWLLATAGLPAARLHPPPRGCAPGWRAGLVAASSVSDSTAPRVQARRTSTAAG
ncbi:MAG TPA: hypothetical protein VFX80_08860 [Solirubrobacteraceae bacterium]|nr:hypothetical protein [Solirubrobacteraceae bacterium]